MAVTVSADRLALGNLGNNFVSAAGAHSKKFKLFFAMNMIQVHNIKREDAITVGARTILCGAEKGCIGRPFGSGSLSDPHERSFMAPFLKTLFSFFVGLEFGHKKVYQTARAFARFTVGREL